MQILIILILLWGFWGQSGQSPVCPPLRDEVRAVYSKDISLAKLMPITLKSGETTYLANATVTTDMVSGEVLVQTGEEPDNGAIEYNKMVWECRVANGEF